VTGLMEGKSTKGIKKELSNVWFISSFRMVKKLKVKYERKCGTPASTTGNCGRPFN
jgi:hypothetical protein